MIPRVPGSRRLSSMRVLSTADRTLQTFPPEHNSDIIQRRGGLVAVPARSATFPSPSFPVAKDGIYQRLTKLLLNVNIENSLGPVHVIVSSYNTVNDVIKVAIEIYVKEKRRPLLEETDPKLFQLHYSQFSLESKSYFPGKDWVFRNSFFIPVCRFKVRGEGDQSWIQEFLLVFEAATMFIGKDKVGIGASVFSYKTRRVVALKL